MYNKEISTFDRFYIYNDPYWNINNRIDFTIIFENQQELAKFMNEVKKCHGDIKVSTKKGIFRVYILINSIKQDPINLLKIEGWAFINKNKNAKW